jgi:hypothetical protein
MLKVYVAYHEAVFMIKDEIHIPSLYKTWYYLKLSVLVSCVMWTIFVKQEISGVEVDKKLKALALSLIFFTIK